MIEIIDITALANPLTDSQFEQLCAQNQDTKFDWMKYLKVSLLVRSLLMF